MRLLKIIFILSFIVLGNGLMNAQYLEKNDQIIVAYYGRPHVSSLGVLGQHSLEELVPIIESKASEYQSLRPSSKVIPAFDIIYDLATAAPGAHGKYIATLSDTALQPYIEKAKEGKFMLFLDLQLGAYSPKEAVQRVLPYLKNKNVHLAIDPEFEVKGAGVRPGKIIGHIDGSDVNDVQQLMQDYIKNNGISEEKFLMVHNFTQKMVRNKKKVQFYDGVNLIMNLDGHGSPSLKINIYNGLYNKTIAAKVSGGFKLFFKEDHPMMTPAEVLGQQSVSGKKMAVMPRFINYQ